MTHDPLRPQVIEVELPPEQAPRPRLAPQVIMTERTDRVIPTEPAGVALREPPPRRSRVVSLGLAGIGVFLAGWFAVDAYWWVAAAFERSTALGSLAATALAAGIAGAGLITVREVASLSRLKAVETIRARLSEDIVRPRDAQAIIGDILAVVPKERETRLAIESFQRQVQTHHSIAQQVEILSRTVMPVLDARAEAHVRSAVLRAFTITAISPTAVSDALFFLACGVRMVRGIAAAYGHRPTAAATVHLLRRILFEAGKLGAVDLASNSLIQTLGGAAAERIAASAADSLYAAYRMARLGTIVMDLCRPIPFRDNDVPSIGSLVSNVIKRRPEDER